MASENVRQPLGSSINKIIIDEEYDPGEIRVTKISKLFTWIVILIILISLFALYFFTRTFQKGLPIPSRNLIVPNQESLNWQKYEMPDNSYVLSLPSEYSKINLYPKDSLVFFRYHNRVSSVFDFSGMASNSSNSSVERELYSSDKLFRTYLRSLKINYYESSITLDKKPATEFYTGQTDGKIPYYAVIQKRGDKYYAFKLLIKPDSSSTRDERFSEITNAKKIFSQILGSVDSLN